MLDIKRIEKIIGRIVARAIAEDASQWITVHPGGKGPKTDGSGDRKGTPVLIDKDTGKILGGMGGKFNGEKIGEIKKNFTGPRTPKNHTAPKQKQEYPHRYKPSKIGSTTAHNTINALDNTPFATGKTAKEYEDVMKQWLPNAKFSFGKIGNASAEGTAEALHTILRSYPELSTTLQGISSVKSMQQDNKERVRELMEDPTFIEKQKSSIDRMKQMSDILYRGYPKDIDEKMYKTLIKSLGASGIPEAKDGYAKFSSLDGVQRSEFIHYIAGQVALKKCAEFEVKRGMGKNSKERVYAWSSRTKGIGLTSFFDDDEKLATAYKNDVAQKFHVPLHGSPAKAIVAHELGHALDYLVDASNDLNIRNMWFDHAQSRYVGTKKDMPDVLSGYANVKPAEMIAEAVCEVYTSPNPRPFSLEVVKRVNELYFEKFEKGRIS